MTIELAPRYDRYEGLNAQNLDLRHPWLRKFISFTFREENNALDLCTGRVGWKQRDALSHPVLYWLLLLCQDHRHSHHGREHPVHRHQQTPELR